METDGDGLIDREEFLKGFACLINPKIDKDQQVREHN